MKTLAQLQQAVVDARRWYYHCEAACPHWDGESDGDGHGCCTDMIEAQEKLSKARKALDAMKRHQENKS